MREKINDAKWRPDESNSTEEPQRQAYRAGPLCGNKTQTFNARRDKERTWVTVLFPKQSRGAHRPHESPPRIAWLAYSCELAQPALFSLINTLTDRGNDEMYNHISQPDTVHRTHEADVDQEPNVETDPQNEMGDDKNGNATQ